MKRKPPLGSVWRILAGGTGRQPRVDIRSSDYPIHEAERGVAFPIERLEARTVFDELVISGVIHVEQMAAREWWVGIGNGEMFTVTVKRDGTVERGEIYR